MIRVAVIAFVDTGGAKNEDGDDEEGLLRRVEVMHEEVTVDMPVIELLRRKWGLLFRERGRAKVDNKRVAQGAACLVDALLSA